MASINLSFKIRLNDTGLFYFLKFFHILNNIKDCGCCNGKKYAITFKKNILQLLVCWMPTCL